MKSGLLLDVVVGKSSAILELLSCEDQSLLLWGNSLFVLDLCLHVGDGVIWLHIEGDGFAGEGLHEDLHGTTTKTKHKMESRFLLDVVVGKSPAILELLSREDQSLLLWRNSLFVLDLCFDIRDSIIWLHIEGDGLAGQSLHENLHGTTTETKHKMKGRLLLDVVV